MPEKLTIEYIESRFKAEGYSLLNNEYINSRSKLDFICPNGHKHNISWDSFRQGARCAICAGQIINPKLVEKSFLSEGYTPLTEYKSAFVKIYYICPNGHKHAITWTHWRNGRRCPYCSGNIKHTYAFIEKQFKREGYTLLSKQYKNGKSHLKYLCPEGHKAPTTWINWRHGRRCLQCFRLNNSGEESNNWKSGVTKRRLAYYDTYAHRLSYCEEIRRSPNEYEILQIRCTRCNEWFTPTINQVAHRIKALEKLSGKTLIEARFYCSQECKDQCPLYKTQVDPFSKTKDRQLKFTYSDLQTWSKEVLERADYKCEYCGKKAEHAHHIQPKKLEPFYALDPDNGIACCGDCHYKYGHRDECSTGRLSHIQCTS